MQNDAGRHYDQSYFDWQRKVGEFTCVANRIKFEDYCSPDKNTVDFGCGGGFMLAGLPAKSKAGVEINPAARKLAKENGLATYATPEALPDDWADLLISDDAREPTPQPLQVPYAHRVRPRVGRKVFDLACKVNGFVNRRKWNEVRVHARRPLA